MRTRDNPNYYKEWKARDPERAKKLARESSRKYRERNPERYAQLVTNYCQSKREFLDNLKSKPCMDCGYTFPPVCMDFDHVRGEKKFDLYKIYRRRKSLVLEEAAKCDIVCSNCHRIRTAQRKPPRWKKNGIKINSETTRLERAK